MEFEVSSTTVVCTAEPLQWKWVAARFGDNLVHSFVSLQICYSSIVTGRNEVLAKVIFLHLSVIHSVHRGAYLTSRTPPGPDPPRDQTPPGTRPPRDQTAPGPDPPPPGTADSGIRSTIGRYASYWNAFLFTYKFSLFVQFEDKYDRK